MIKHEDKKRKQDLGIFYTPQEVVDFLFEILNTWKKKQITRWETKEGKQKYPSIIDPAVGEGGFLKVALEKKFTKPDWIFGLDIDEKAVNKWKEINLLKEFGGKDKDLEAHFFHQNGLEKIKWKQHLEKYKYKLKQVDIENQQFDTVVGNPPYGGVGLGETELTDDLIAQLTKFEILPKSIKDDLNMANTQEDLFGSDKSFSLKPNIKQRIKSFPIETFFLERFIQLAKPGGWIIIIIPDGILANSNSHYVREFISKKIKIMAIVSLPRDTFKIVGTTAKTSILFLRKLKENEKPSQDYTVFLSSTENVDKANFQKIENFYQKFYNEEINMNKSELIQITKDQTGKELVMVRVDKTLQELMNEKPASRWDPNYWHPKFDNLFTGIKTELFDKYIIDVQGGGGGSHFSAFLGDKWETENGYARYLHISSLMHTGINWVDAKYVNKATYERLKSKQLRENDILLSNKGTVGKSVVVYRNFIKTIVGDTRVIRVNNINPYYLCIYLKSWYGSMLSEKFKSGVASEGTTVEQLREFPVPIISSKIQIEIESEYKKMSGYHDKAMEAKKNSDNNEFKINLDIAEKMLKDLISRTEAVIRIERENVI